MDFRSIRSFWRLPEGKVFVAICFIFLALFGAWVSNIVKLISMGFDPLTGMAVARVIGVFLVPVGIILGLF